MLNKLRSHGSSAAVLWLAVLAAMCFNVHAFELFDEAANLEHVFGRMEGVAVMEKSMQERTSLIVLRFPELSWFELTHEDAYYAVGNIKISPDGQWIVYNDFSLPNNMYLREIAEDSQPILLGVGFYPHWLADSPGETMYLVYSSLDDKSLTEKYDGYTFRQEFRDGELVGEPDTLLDQAFKAGVSKNGRWLATADKTPMLYDLHEQRLHVLTLPEGGQSTCFPVRNPTMDPDNMDQVCYINKAHDSLITKDSRDSVVHWLALSTVMKTSFDAKNFQSNGWSNIENIMLTGYRQSNGTQCMMIVRRGDKMMWPVCIGGPHQDLWLAEEPTAAARRVLKVHSGKTDAAPRRVIGAFAPAASIHAIYDVRGARLPVKEAAAMATRRSRQVRIMTPAR